METKVCCKCGEEKLFTNQFFPKDPKGKNNLSNRCIICNRTASRIYRENNLEKAKASNLASQKKYREERTLLQKKWRHNNKEKCSQHSKKYYENNKRQVLDYSNEYVKKRYKEDVLFRLNALLRSSIHRWIYKNKSTKDYIGCSIEDFKKHIENQFQENMTWGNQGRLENVWGWELDHIIPASSAQSEEELHKLYHYTNFQPLWKKENLSKGDKLPKEWLSENTSN